MSNMSYCRHENTYNDLVDVWNEWYDFDPEEASKYEIEARKKLKELVIEMADEIKNDD